VSTATASFDDELQAEQIARRFTDARLQARALADYPGSIPPSLDAAYRIQEAAIGQWPDRIVGWKLGRIPDPWVSRLGAGRLAGPIFSRQVLKATDGEVVEFSIFEGGFAAVEAEFIFRLGADQPRGRADWSIEDAAALVETLIVGVEPAGSPLATINELGPCVVVSDFGNNGGLILGPEVADWRGRLDALTCETWIEGRRVGQGGARTIPNGPLDSLRVLLGICERRDRPLKAGDLISTGAATGIHDIVAGQSSRVVFDGVGEILCRAVPRQAETD
jgi:2-keto-4-pentenoate hydratase